MKQNFSKKLDRFIDEYYKNNKNSGYLRITSEDKIIYEKFIGFADIENKIPFTKDSMFTFYSLTKPFCAIGLLKLKDKNLVDIDCHPAKYIPEAAGFDERVTIRQMLHHISGLPDFVQTAKLNEKNMTGTPEQIREQLKDLSKYPMVFEPGTEGMYANINYILCALIIENVSGMKYDYYMQKEVFEPLGMNTAQVDNKDLVINNRVKGYAIQGNNIVEVDKDTDWMFGAGDIIGTADDVYCLNKAIKHKLLLKPETWEEALTPTDIFPMGMGCMIFDWHGKKRINHNGGSEGFRTLHVQIPEDDFDIILLSNSGWGEARDDFAEAIYEFWYGDNTDAGKKVKMDAGYI